MVRDQQEANSKNSGCLFWFSHFLRMWRENKIKPCSVSPEKVEVKNGLSVIHEKKFRKNMRSGLSRWGCLPPSLTTWVQFLGPTWRRKRVHSQEEFQPPHTGPCTWVLSLHIHTHTWVAVVFKMWFSLLALLHLEIFIYSNGEKSPLALNDITYHNFILVL